MTELPEKEHPASQQVPEAAVAKEVASAGVRVQPTTIPIPQPLTKMGVQPGSANVPPPAAVVTLPLTDDQIAKGLHASITSSLRWLAEWCKKKLKQIHQTIRRYA